jgi:pimeloyl-ACP methyl ester carboxylesterase
VFLHEGLGCVALWRDFPARLAEATGLPALVYSRFGYGGSDGCALPRPVRYMHDEGLEVLPALLRAAGIDRHILVGHSDGASIALIYAGGTAAPGLEALVVEAPHVFVEAMNLKAIAGAREAYRTTDLRQRLAKYHGGNVDCAFEGWSGAWLDPAFADWNLESYLPAIGVPMLILQGADDEYGTVAQCDAIERAAGGGAEVIMLPECGHAPHKDQADRVLGAMTAFSAKVAGRQAATVEH